MSTPTITSKRIRPVFKIGAIDDQEKFRALPAPTGEYPYHLNVEQFIPAITGDRLTFQLCGDTGGIQQPFYQHQVVKAMISQFQGQTKPDFFFHLGDVVYNFGQAHEYEPQYFKPFKNYPAPVFAIPGNHDGDIDPFDILQPNSLDAFVKVFCAGNHKPVDFAGNSGFLSSTQPNVYFKLTTPLADIIALYSNVPRFGTIDNQQRDWFIQELKNHKKNNPEKALILCLHHSAYSADTNHGSSLNMQLFLEEAFNITGILPDIVFSGHVHNYQRFTKTYQDKKLPFIVTGAGGYAQLHTIAAPNDPAYPDTSQLLDNVVLENYCCTNHGFIRVEVVKSQTEFYLSGNYFIIDDNNTQNTSPILFDSFRVNLFSGDSRA